MASQANDLRFVQVTDVRYNSAEDNGTFAKTIQDIVLAKVPLSSAEL